MKKFLVFTLLAVSLLYGSLAKAVEFEYLLDDPPSYERSIGPVWVAQHSPVDIYVQNILDPQRWKEWYIEIWIPETIDDLTCIDIDYDNTANHSDPLEVFSVPLAPLGGEPLFAGFKGFYADTFEEPWLEFGTTPVGSGGLHPWGNPEWVSFHINVTPDNTPIAFYIDDFCIPEPATLLLLTLGGCAFWTRGRIKR